MKKTKWMLVVLGLATTVGIVGAGPALADGADVVFDDLVGSLYINEFMADNETTIPDPDNSGGYPDWIEIYNATSSTIALGGLFMTDDLVNPSKWQIPLGVSIGPYDYLLFWADNDEPQGLTHTSFKLSASGEEIGLFDYDGATEIDSVVFGAQLVDVSYGRYPDGADSWDHKAAATPGEANGPHNGPPVISGTAHSPAWPTVTDSVWVTASVIDDGSVVGVTLTYDAGGGAVVLPMFDNGAYGDGGAGDDVYGARMPPHSSGTVVRYYVSATDGFGAPSTDPSTAPTVAHSFKVGYTQPLSLNEFMADNHTTIEDPDDLGAYEDWFEIFNAGATTVDLAGMCLTDDASDPYRWQVPGGVTIGPGVYLLVWAGDDDEQGDTHTNFKLGAAGEYLGF